MTGHPDSALVLNIIAAEVLRSVERDEQNAYQISLRIGECANGRWAVQVTSESGLNLKLLCSTKADAQTANLYLQNRVHWIFRPATNGDEISENYWRRRAHDHQSHESTGGPGMKTGIVCFVRNKLSDATPTEPTDPRLAVMHFLSTQEATQPSKRVERWCQWHRVQFGRADNLESARKQLITWGAIETNRGLTKHTDTRKQLR